MLTIGQLDTLKSRGIDYLDKEQLEIAYSKRLADLPIAKVRFPLLSPKRLPFHGRLSGVSRSLATSAATSSARGARRALSAT